MVAVQSASREPHTLTRKGLSRPTLGPRQSVLLAEDEGPLRGVLSYALEIEGFKILPANDGFEALCIARREEPLVAILDIVMPRMGGDDVCSVLRADPHLGSMFIVLISALPPARTEEIARAVDADLFLCKPVDHDVLVEVISSVFEHRTGRAPRRALHG